VHFILHFIKKILSYFVLLWFATCQFDPYADKLCVIQPSIHDIVGKYRFQFQTVDADAKDSTFFNATIVLDDSLNYTATNIPDFIQDQYSGRINKKGHWRMATVGGTTGPNGKDENVFGIILDSMP